MKQFTFDCSRSHWFSVCPFTAMSDSAAVVVTAAQSDADVKRTYSSLDEYVRLVGGKRVIRKVLIANNVRTLTYFFDVILFASACF
jgi:hypothetical protein